MTHLANAAAVWIPPSGVLPGPLLFNLVPASDGWMIVAGLLALVCALLSIVTGARRPFGAARSRVQRSPAAKGPQPQHI